MSGKMFLVLLEILQGFGAVIFFLIASLSTYTFMFTQPNPATTTVKGWSMYWFGACVVALSISMVVVYIFVGIGKWVFV